MTDEYKLIRPPFTSLKTQEERDKDKRKIISVSLNEQDQEMLNDFMHLIEQDQPSKAIRQAFHIAHANVIHDSKVNALLTILFKNKRNNERRGVAEFE